MNMYDSCRPQFRTGDTVLSLVEHPPEIKSGTECTIVSPQTCVLYAVQLPDGELHRWFAGFELQGVNTPLNIMLPVGSTAKVLTDYGHPPTIEKGMLVKKVKAIPRANFYDVRVEDNSYHRWLAETEVACPIVESTKSEANPVT